MNLIDVVVIDVVNDNVDDNDDVERYDVEGDSAVVVVDVNDDSDDDDDDGNDAAVVNVAGDV